MVQLTLTFDPSIRTDLETYLKQEKARCDRDVPKKLSGNRITAMLTRHFKKAMGFEMPCSFTYHFSEPNECFLIFDMPELPLPKLNYVANLLCIGVQNRFKKEYVKVKVHAG